MSLILVASGAHPDYPLIVCANREEYHARAVEPAGWLPHANFELNYRVFLYAVGLAVVFGVLSGIYPAWRMSRLHPVEALRGHTR